MCQHIPSFSIQTLSLLFLIQFKPPRLAEIVGKLPIFQLNQEIADHYSISYSLNEADTDSKSIINIASDILLLSVSVPCIC